MVNYCACVVCIALFSVAISCIMLCVAVLFFMQCSIFSCCAVLYFMVLCCCTFSCRTVCCCTLLGSCSDVLYVVFLGSFLPYFCDMLLAICLLYLILYLFCCILFFLTVFYGKKACDVMLAVRPPALLCSVVLYVVLFLFCPAELL